MKYYVTTTLPYVNGKPHCGAALEFVQADVIARYKRLKLGKKNVFFNLGTDEHGLKIYTKAKKVGKTPKEYVDGFAVQWKEFCEQFSITYDNFYRTSDNKHKKLAKEFWKICDKNGWIYKKEYSGLYCVGCEGFKTEKDLVDGKCPDHKTEPIEYSEENYFFKLSAFTEDLLDYLDGNPEFIKPKHKQKELRNFIAQGLEDISISREKENLPWGIEVPDDPDQVFYVWFDALTNYVFAVGYLQDNERFEQFWPGVQLCGTDNVRFQGAIWQGMLAGADLPFSKKILAHGWALAEDGSKMSKTIGNVVDPVELAEDYSVEAVRYYLIAGVPTYDDFPVSIDRLKSIHNDHLADRYGNLINRIIHLANSKEMGLDGVAEVDFKNKVDVIIEEFDNLMDNYELSNAYEEIAKMTAWGNQYITKKEPWGKEKSELEVEQILNNLYYLLKKATYAYQFVIPDHATEAQLLLDKHEKGVLFEKL